MAINAGENVANDLYWGVDRVKRVYLGESLVHQAKLTKSEQGIYTARHTEYFSGDELNGIYTKLRVRASLTLSEGGTLESTSLRVYWTFKYAEASEDGLDHLTGTVGSINKIQAGTTGTVEKEILLSDYPSEVSSGSYPSDLIEIEIELNIGHDPRKYPGVYADIECALLA